MISALRETKSDTTRMLALFETTAEEVKTRLSRALHDDLGGLLVAAVMDSAWAEQHLSGNQHVRERLGRIRESLAAAIDLKRKMIEDLRPSLLENFGLFAALRWHHKHYCAEAALRCSESYPEEEPSLAPSASTTLFRIVQEALTAVTRQSSAKSAHLGIELSQHELSIHVHHDGDVLSAKEREEADLVSFWLIEHRVRALGGKVSIVNPQTGGMKLCADIPLERIVLA